MKGYKGFKKGLICHGKQFAENTVFEEESAELFKGWTHFCENPFDMLEHYGLIDIDGTFSEFAEVEALDEARTDDAINFITAKLRIGAKLSFTEFIKACVDFILEKSATRYANVKTTTIDDEVISSDVPYVRIGNSGRCTQICSAGNDAQIGSSGDSVYIASAGWRDLIASAGRRDSIASAGLFTKIGSTGEDAAIGVAGESVDIRSEGNSASIASAGRFTKIGSTGEDAVICCAGRRSKVRAKKGSWITLSEWEYSIEKGRAVPKCVKTEYVDGERIKEDTFYELVNGEFKEICYVDSTKPNVHKEIFMANTINNLKNALKSFGIKGQATGEYISEDMVVVTVNGEYFGLWDCDKKTFVD